MESDIKKESLIMRWIKTLLKAALLESSIFCQVDGFLLWKIILWCMKHNGIQRHRMIFQSRNPST